MIKSKANALKFKSDSGGWVIVRPRSGYCFISVRHVYFDATHLREIPAFLDEANKDRAEKGDRNDLRHLQVAHVAHWPAG